MKIPVVDLPFEEVEKKSPAPHFKPKKPNFFFRSLVRILAVGELKSVRFSYRCVGMDRLGKHQPALYLMNHSSFIDLKIASKLLYPKPYQIVCTQDGFVGKQWLMRQLGCIPKKKFIPEVSPVRDMLYALRTLHTSVLMFPEASYSFDGTATPLPDSVGKCLKLLNVPVVMIRTFGAFAHDPLYNGLQLRNVPVSAEMKYLLSPEEIAEKSVDELNDILRKEFTFDNFRWQFDNNISVSEPFRADNLNRVLYKCPHCLAEGKTVGKGTLLTCRACGVTYELTERGNLKCLSGEGKFDFVTDWFAWERTCVRDEINNGSYRMEDDVDICVLKDYKQLYRVGEGHLVHDTNGFLLDGCDGKIHFRQNCLASYSLYSDYYWYEIGDMISIGDGEHIYYCFPKSPGDTVAKARIATEEMYKIHR